jgi:ABC-type multidrug transport system ATPase subunit
MRITKINIPKSNIDNGLEAVKMHRLGQVVLLAGKNGSGKTRLLNLISTTIKNKPKKTNIDNIIKNMELLTEKLNIGLRAIDTYQSGMESKDNSVNKVFKDKIMKQEQSNNSVQDNLDAFEKRFNWDLIETDATQESYNITHFVPKSVKITDCNSLSKGNMLSYAKSLDEVGVNQLAQGTFARIQVIQDRWVNATHQNLKVSQAEKDTAIADYDKLKKLTKIILNTDIRRSIDGDPTLFGFPLGQSNLSDGQKVLLQMCLAIHCQQESLDGLILFLDEPENHLHPSVIIETIQRIIKHIPNGQVWIATHSISLLSYFDPSNIWFIENNRVSYAGRVPEKVLQSLLGSDDQISKLQDFISLPGIFALNRHAYESLFHPDVATNDGQDPQTLQIRDEIKNHLQDENKIRILDYGAGKGRLLANIIENNEESISTIATRVDYIAYDKFDSNKEDCLSTIKKIYENEPKRYFNDLSELFGLYDKESFDIVIMCNVLHEIDPKDWLKLFSADGEITSLLSEKGILLLVEDQEMLIGEKAYQKGFIVLNTAELKELFQITEQDDGFGFSDANNDGRLKAHRIPKIILERITAETRLQAITSLHITSSTEILKIRESEINYKNGKKHGFWIQQFANTGLALTELR